MVDSGLQMQDCQILNNYWTVKYMCILDFERTKILDKTINTPNFSFHNDLYQMAPSSLESKTIECGFKKK